jgi:hypothetical protein
MDKKKIDPLILLNTDPDGEYACEVRSEIKRMKKPVIVDKSEFRPTQISRYVSAIVLIALGIVYAKFFPEDRIVGDWKTGGVLTSGGAVLLAHTVILSVANNAIDIFERFMKIKRGKND